MELQLRLVSLLGIVSSVYGQDCSDFTLGSCDFDETAIVGSVNLPADKNAFLLCQDFCQNDELCNNFVFDASVGYCTTYSQVDYTTCQVQSGPINPDVADCQFTGTGGCNEITETDCRFGIGISTTGVDSAEECQQLLRQNADTFGSDYFVYDAGDTTCTLIDGGDSRTCSSITGPAFPDFEDECVALRLVIGLGYDGTIASDGLYRDDFESFQVDSENGCEALPAYPRGGKTGAVSGVVNGALWVCGGYLGNVRVTTDLCYSFQGASGWREEATMTDIREMAAAVVDVAGNFFISGGEDFTIYRNTVEMLSDPDGSWEVRDDMELPNPRTRHCMALFDGSKIMLAGGSEQQNQYPNSTYVFDLNAPQLGWVRQGDLNAARQYADCIEVGGRVMIVGGDTLGAGQDTIEWFDPDTGSWSFGEPLPEFRQGLRLAKETRDSTRVFLAGGFDPGFNYLKDVLVYDLDSDSWSDAGFELDGGRAVPIIQFVPEASLPECN